MRLGSQRFIFCLLFIVIRYSVHSVFICTCSYSSVAMLLTLILIWFVFLSRSFSLLFWDVSFIVEFLRQICVHKVDDFSCVCTTHDSHKQINSISSHVCYHHSMIFVPNLKYIFHLSARQCQILTNCLGQHKEMYPTDRDSVLNHSII